MDVYLKGVTNLPTKLIQVRKTIGHTVEGKPIRKSFYAKTKREGERKYLEFLKEAEKENKTALHYTFSEFSKVWLETKRDEVNDNTYKQTYLTNMKVLEAAFGDKLLESITQINLQKFFSAQSGISKSKMDKLYLIANAVFSTAFENDLIDKNPMTKVKKGQVSNPKELRTYTDQQYRFVIDFAKDHPYGLGVFIMLKTGLRRSELFALKWDSIDFGKKIMYIKNAAVKEFGSYVIDKTKTFSSMRQIPLDDEFVNHLKNQTQHSEYIITLGSKLNQIADLDNWTKRRYNPFILDLSEFYIAEKEKANVENYDPLPKLRIHELRHTYGTLLYRSGTDVYTVSKILGHADVQITTKIYVHDTVEDIRSRIDFTKLP